MQQVIVLLKRKRILTYTHTRQYYFQWNHTQIYFIIPNTIAEFWNYMHFYDQLDIALNQKILI